RIATGRLRQKRRGDGDLRFRPARNAALRNGDFDARETRLRGRPIGRHFAVAMFERSLAFEHAPREREIVLDGAACTVARYRAKRPRPADLDDARRRRDDDREQRTREFEELALAFEVVRLLR